MNYTITLEDGTTLYHHGILGQKWGIRRYQNKDGSLTEAGKKRYNSKFVEKYKAREVSKVGRDPFKNPKIKEEEIRKILEMSPENIASEDTLIAINFLSGYKNAYVDDIETGEWTTWKGFKTKDFKNELRTGRMLLDVQRKTGKTYYERQREYLNKERKKRK